MSGECTGRAVRWCITARVVAGIAYARQPVLRRAEHTGWCAAPSRSSAARVSRDSRVVFPGAEF